MPFDAGGTFTRSYSWQADRDAGIKILAQRMDGEFNNYAGGLNQTFLRTGIVPMGGPLNMNSNPIVGIAGGTLISPGIRFESDTDTGIYSSGPGNITLVADGVAALSAVATGVYINGAMTLNGAFTTTGLTVNGPATVNGALTSSSLQVNGNINAAGSVGSFAAGTGGITLVPGNVSVSGYISFTNTTNTLVSWIGQANIASGALSYNSAGGHNFAGGIFATNGVYLDPTFWAGISSSMPIINFDANDYMRYDRGANILTTYVSGGAVLQLSPGAANVVSGLLYVGDAQHYLQQFAGGALHRFDAGDSMLYDRNANQVIFYIGDQSQLSIGANQSITVGNSGAGVVYIGSGNTYIGGDGSQSTWLFEPGSYIQYNKSTDTIFTVINGGIYQNITPALFTVNQAMKVGGNAQFDTTINVTGVAAVQRLDIAGGGYYMTFLGSTNGPFINFDANDYMIFDRAVNQYVFVVGGASVATIDYAGLRCLGGYEAGYRDLPMRDVSTPGGNLSGSDRGRSVRFVGGASNYGVPDLGSGAIVTVINHSGIVQTLVQVGCTIYWAATNTAGAVNLQPGAVATILWVPGAACTISGTGVYR